MHVTDRRSSRLASDERAIQAVLTGHDAPFIYASLDVTFCCDTGKTTVTVARATFPHMRLYIDGTRVADQDQTGLAQFIKSGGTSYSTDGHGVLGPAGAESSHTQTLCPNGCTVAPPRTTRPLYGRLWRRLWAKLPLHRVRLRVQWTGLLRSLLPGRRLLREQRPVLRWLVLARVPLLNRPAMSWIRSWAKLTSCSARSLSSVRRSSW